MNKWKIKNIYKLWIQKDFDYQYVGFDILSLYLIHLWPLEPNDSILDISSIFLTIRLTRVHIIFMEGLILKSTYNIFLYQ